MLEHGRWHNAGRFGTKSTHCMTFASDDTVAMTIDTSQNVGIGVNTPDGRLQVYGISRFSCADSVPSGTANTVLNDAVFGSTDTANTGITLLGSAQVGIAFGDEDNTEIAQIRYQHSTNAFEFRTKGAEVMRVDCSGRVGIGTTPAAWDSSYDGVLQIANSSIADNSGTQLDVGLNFYYDGSYTKISDGLASRYTQSAGEHYWSTVATGTGTFTFSEVMRIDADGNVGIGTNNPTCTLEVWMCCGAHCSNLILTNDHADGYQSAIEFCNGHGSGFSNARISGGVEDTGDGYIRFQVGLASTLTNVGYWDSDGNLAIGNDSPAAKLHCNG